MNPTVSALFKSLHQFPNAGKTPSMKKGQLISAKISEILPKNQAILNMGGTQVKAQLEMPLTKGERYVLQVTATNELPHLSLVSQKPFSVEWMRSLIKEAGSKPSEKNVEMLRHLFQNGASPTKDEVFQALNLFRKFGGRSRTKDVITHILRNQMPMKESVFLALSSRESLSSVLTQDRNLVNTGDQRLKEIIGILGGKSSPVTLLQSLSSRLLHETSINKRNTFLFLQKAEIISPELSFEKFQQEVSKWRGQSNGALTLDDALQSIKKGSESPFPALPSQRLLPTMVNNVFKAQLPSSSRELFSLKNWLTQAEKAMNLSSANLSSDFVNRFQALHQNLADTLVFKKLEHHIGQDFTILRKQLDQLFSLNGSRPVELSREIVGKLQTLLEKQMPESVRPQLVEWAFKAQPTASEFTKEAFLLKIKAMLHLSGINDEAIIHRDVQQNVSVQRESTLKSLVVQRLQDESVMSTKPEVLKQVLNILNGMQLTSQQDHGQMLQLAFHIPSISQDAYVNIEGKKNNEGIIDPDSCHILFYLDLKHLKETVIDLMIVKRQVTLTVYNENEMTPILTKEHKGNLEIGLEKLGYSLLSINVKGGHPLNQAASFVNSEHTGVDFRI
ncbi:hypothetical protein [Halobacillus campisalis]|uniref:Flagellar hook-length control protein-like C-terminal domain-containing protein n=1 Tax=Halobacillus campisalis TaxID=435909 RepID=A0ABW2K2S4_9BACI|nr:hypothetical protein [Halobacillus campisalis]